MFKGSFSWKIPEEKSRIFANIFREDRRRRLIYKCCSAAVGMLAASFSKEYELISGDKTGITTMSSIVINKKTLSAFLRYCQISGKKERGLKI